MEIYYYASLVTETWLGMDAESTNHFVGVSSSDI
jgi:hypothetical protein